MATTEIINDKRTKLTIDFNDEGVFSCSAEKLRLLGEGTRVKHRLTLFLSRICRGQQCGAVPGAGDRNTRNGMVR